MSNSKVVHISRDCDVSIISSVMLLAVRRGRVRDKGQERSRGCLISVGRDGVADGGLDSGNGGS